MTPNHNRPSEFVRDMLFYAAILIVLGWAALAVAGWGIFQ